MFNISAPLRDISLPNMGDLGRNLSRSLKVNPMLPLDAPYIISFSRLTETYIA